MKNAIFVLSWVVLLVGAAVLALAIDDYQRQESERLARVHAQGMAVGATMCGGRS